jgi:hypothetical protein
MFEKRQKLIALARGWNGSGRASTVRAGKRKQIGVEEILRWAYARELPKAQELGPLGAPGLRAGWDAIARYGEHLALVDQTNIWGVTPDRVACDDPHPDAIAVAQAVLALDELELGLPEGWDPFADFGDLGEAGMRARASVIDRLVIVDADGVRRLRSPVSRLVFRQAILGGCPDYEAEQPEMKTLCGENGHPKYFVRRLVTSAYSDVPFEVEADGWSYSSRRPVAGAYTKTFLDPDPVEAGVSRGEYEIWRAALDVLAQDLAGLAAHEVLPCERPLRPWESGELEDPRILPDLQPARVAGVAQARKKGRARMTDRCAKTEA